MRQFARSPEFAEANNVGKLEILARNDGDEDLFATIWGSLSEEEMKEALVAVSDVVLGPPIGNTVFLKQSVDLVPMEWAPQVFSHNDYRAFRTIARVGDLDAVILVSSEVGIDSWDDMVRVDDLEYLAATGNIDNLGRLFGMMNRHERMPDIDRTLRAAVSSDRMSEAQKYETEVFVRKIAFVTANTVEDSVRASRILLEVDDIELRQQLINSVAGESEEERLNIASRLGDIEIVMNHLMSHPEEERPAILERIIAASENNNPNLHSFFSEFEGEPDITDFIVEIENLARVSDIPVSDTCRFVMAFRRNVSRDLDGLGGRVGDIMFEELCKECPSEILEALARGNDVWCSSDDQISDDNVAGSFALFVREANASFGQEVGGEFEGESSALASPVASHLAFSSRGIGGRS